ncbi:MAG: DNA polymerase III subunit delta' [Bacteroidota bacterium]
MYFREIPGQDEIKDRLIRSVKDERISHAVLMYGPEGCGKLALAIAFARYLSCTNRQEKDACGECTSCKKYAKLAHPDLHFSFPTSAADKDPGVEELLETWRDALLENPFLNQYNWYEKIGLENKQGIIGSRQSSAIIRKLGLKAFESDYKILIMWLSEKMNEISANKLLKMIEEPPRQTIFILVSESPDDILPTIRSRTQILRIPKIKNEAVRAALQEKTGASDEVIENAVRLSNGNFNLALASFQSDTQNKQNFERFVDLMRLAYKKEIVKILNWVDEMAGLSRERQKLFVLNALRLIRENFMVHLDKPEITHMAGYEDEFSIKFSQFVNTDNIAHIYQELNDAYNHISANGYARIVFLDMSLKMVRYLHM